MCGIVGTVGSPGLPGETVERMSLALGHRGPDDEGWMVWDGQSAAVGRGRPPSGGLVTFGHTRLAIIDLSQGGHQPMATSDGRFWITYNGELYNYLEIRKQLEEAGHVFRSESDTEVVLRSWQEWGKACLARFVGMFAFGLLDTTAKVVHLVRDPFGIKPLFYARGHGLAFASEIPALLEHPGVPRSIDPMSTYDYLRWGLTDHGERTLFSDVRRVDSGTRLTFEAETGRLLDEQVYWALGSEPREISFKDSVDELRERFLDSLSLHLRSDVEVGTALSGGIDSSAILCGSRNLLGAQSKIHCFSYVTEDPRYDERQWIELASTAAWATLHRVRISSGDLVRDLDALVKSQGEPFGGTSIYAQRRVFEAASDAGVTVLLDGQGADELFAGYRSYLASQFASLVKAGRLGAAAALARQVVAMPGVEVTPRILLRVLAGAVPPSARRPLLLASGRRSFPTWLDRAWFTSRGVFGHDAVAGRVTSLEQTLERAFSSTSLPALLRYEDCNSMASSRESRVPFLTPDLVNFVFSLPRDHLVGSDGTSKLVFRAAMRGIVPDAILDRRDKIGFNTPEDVWLREQGSLVTEALESPAARLLPLRTHACARSWARIERGKDRCDARVWRWVNLVRWAEIFDVDL